MVMASSENRTWYIYCHTAPNGKRYFGQTCQKPEYRWNDGNGYKNQTHFKRAIDKYGWENFQHTILCTVSSKENADFLEQWFIKKFRTYERQYGYNLTMGGGGAVGYSGLKGPNSPLYGKKMPREVVEKRVAKVRGRKASAETRMRQSIGLRNSEKVKAKQIPVLQLDDNNNVIRRYESLTSAANAVGVTKTAIDLCCKGKCNTVKGFHWAFEDDAKRVAANEVASERLARKPTPRPVVQLDKDENIVAYFDSAMDASRKLNIAHTHIYACCNGQIEHYLGWKWQYAKDVDKQLAIE